jgi:plasmid stabilization system protein ParE
MPTESATFHEEASAEYDAAFDWYVERSPDAARKFDEELDRALAQIVRAPQRWAVGPHSQVLTSTIPFHTHLP